MTDPMAPISSATTRTSILNDPRSRSLIGVAVLALLTLITYSRTITSDFIWDDDKYVIQNPNLRSFEGIRQIWTTRPVQTQWYPLTLTSFWIDYHLWGLRPLGFHVVNVALQVANALLLWVILRRLLVPGAWVIAAIFAVHPTQVETVAWVAERKNLLSGLFYFLTALVYLRYSGITPDPKPRKQLAADEPEPMFQLPTDPARLYVLILFLFACALLSKSVTSTLPAVLLLIIWWKRGRIVVADLLPLLPMFVMGLAMSAVTRFVESNYIIVRGEGWALAPTLVGDKLARVIVAGRVVWFYAMKLLVPHPLIFNYPRWTISPDNVVGYLAPLGVIVVLAALFFMRKRIGRGAFAGAAFFVITLVPAMGFVNFYPMRYSFVADHFQYLASIGLIAIVVAGLVQGSRQLIATDALSPAVLPACAIVVLGAYSILSFAHSGTFVDLNSLWKNTLDATAQRSWMATQNYGVLLLERGEREYARKYFLRTLKLNPGHAEARYKLGQMADEEGHYDESLRYFRESLEQNPPYPESEVGVVQELLKLNRADEAFAAAQALVEHRPDDAKAHGMLGLLLARQGKMQEALEQYAAAVDVAPNSALAHFNYAAALMRAGQVNESLQEYAATIKLDQTDAGYINGFGTAWLFVNKPELARPLFEKAIALSPKYADAYFNLGLLDQKELKLEDSKKNLELAVKYDPKSKRNADALERTIDWIEHPSKRPTTRSTTEPASAPTTEASR